jgi:molecular chaperone GrpE (heat shock protein)
LAQRSNFIVRGGADFSGITKALNKTQTQISTFQKTVSKSMKLISAAIGTIAIGSLVKDSIKAASELEGAMTGLESIVSGQGRSINRAKEFINSYVEDGLVPLNNAVTAYKNLVSRGYDDDQIEAVMNRLKDAAAFGRQSSYSLGEAVQTATEGLKNENSVLVDNAGVTKNVSKMWDEYAKSIGKNRNQLTQQEKIQAEVNGIMKETQWQVGDAAKYTETFAGRLSALNKTLTDIKINLGNAFMPIANIALPLLQSLASRIENITAHFAALSQTLFGKSTQVTVKNTEVQTNAISDYGDAVEKAGKQAKNALAPFDEINKINSSGSGTTTGLSGETNTSLTPVTVEATDKSEAFTYSIEKLQEKIEPTIDALERFKDALKPIGKFAFDNIKNFYDKALKPIGEWVLGDGLPRLLDVGSELLRVIDWDKLTNALSNLYDAISPMVVGIGSGLISFIEDLSVVLKPVLATTADLLADAIDALAKSIGRVDSQTWEDAGKAIGIIGTTLGSIKIVDKLPSWLLKVGMGLGTLATNIANLAYMNPIALPALFDLLGLDDWLDDLYEKLPDWVKGLWEGFWQFIYDGVVDIFNFDATFKIWELVAKKFKDAFNGDTWYEIGWNIIEGIFLGIAGILSFPLEIVDDFFATLWKNICNVFGINSPAKEMEPLGVYIMQGLIKGFKDGWNNVWDGLATWLGAKPREIADAFGSLVSWFKTKGGQVITGIKNGWDDGWSSFKLWLGKIPSKIVSAIGSLYDVGKDLIKSFITGLKAISLPKLNVSIGTDTKSFFGNDIQIPKLNVEWRADGGFVNDGQMFVARENGIPEMVGRIGNRTAVANNDQITDSISGAVKSAIVEVLVPALSGIGSNGNGDTIINIDGKEVFRAVKKQSSEYYDMTGKSPFPV